MARAARKPSRAELRARAEAAARAVALPDGADVLVVGGGAAGLAAAVCAAEAGARTVVLERGLACGRTILATGNGRCNFSNERLSWDAYNDPAFVKAVCGEGFGRDVLTFFRDAGLAWASEEGRLYPASRQAASVREVLLARAARAGVTLAPWREVRAAEGGGAHGWRVRFACGDEPGGLCARAVVVACGGGEALAGSLGLASAAGQPVLCPLACAPEAGVGAAGTKDAAGAGLLEALDGRRAHVAARLERDGREVFCERGELLFRAYGVSGIVAFDLSRHARRGDTLRLDLTDGLGREGAQKLAEAAGSLAGIVDPVVAHALNDSVDTACDLRLVVRGTAEPERAQVTRGGLLTTQFDPKTLMARERPGLFAAGEALDVDAACGGFNLAWAWKSGMVAGASAASFAKEHRC